jgi:2-aminoethylphosphonate-pyruvate transaminase
MSRRRGGGAPEAGAAVSRQRAAEARDKVLFTPGPLTTSRMVKEAMLRDLGSRDFEFIALVREIREALLRLADAGKTHEAVLMQGSGTFGVEAVVSSTTPPAGKWLVVANGAYGERIATMAARAGIAHAVLRCAENDTPAPRSVDDALAADPTITNVFVVHCETTTGIVNPVTAIGDVVHGHGRVFAVDAMSSFGAVPIDVGGAHIDFLVSSANKCLEGTPGVAIVLARREALACTEGYARSLSLDLFDQWRGLEANGQFRFTPPTHVLLALRQALRELDAEGGVDGRARRYRANYEALVAGMRATGFTEYLRPERQGYVITSFRYPQHPRFSFEEFYQGLNRKGMVIYPGKVSNADCFRIGNIGRISTTDIEALLVLIRETLSEMDIRVPLEAEPAAAARTK